jgi:hypothetical protein
MPGASYNLAVVPEWSDFDDRGAFEVAAGIDDATENVGLLNRATMSTYLTAICQFISSPLV